MFSVPVVLLGFSHKWNNSNNQVLLLYWVMNRSISQYFHLLGSSLVQMLNWKCHNISGHCHRIPTCNTWCNQGMYWDMLIVFSATQLSSTVQLLKTTSCQRMQSWTALKFSHPSVGVVHHSKAKSMQVLPPRPFILLCGSVVSTETTWAVTIDLQKKRGQSHHDFTRWFVDYHPEASSSAYCCAIIFGARSDHIWTAEWSWRWHASLLKTVWCIAGI